jgi:hypothetical protein
MENAKSIDVDARDGTGRTLLLAALDTKQLEVARLLLKRGASLSAVDSKGRGVISIAIKLHIKDLLINALDRGITVPESEMGALMEWCTCEMDDDWKCLKDFIERKIIPINPAIPKLPVCTCHLRHCYSSSYIHDGICNQQINK